MTDRELLVELVTDQGYIRGDVIEIKEHQKETNGHIAALSLKQSHQEGSISTLRLIGGMTLAGVGAGAAVAGVILTLVARGM